MNINKNIPLSVKPSLSIKKVLILKRQLPLQWDWDMLMLQSCQDDGHLLGFHPNCCAGKTFCYRCEQQWMLDEVKIFDSKKK